jgi:hypothetical protein
MAMGGGTDDFDLDAWKEWWRSTFPRPSPFVDERGWLKPEPPGARTDGGEDPD